MEFIVVVKDVFRNQEVGGKPNLAKNEINASFASLNILVVFMYFFIVLEPYEHGSFSMFEKR